jgi:Family of unknown function (DUF6476)
MQSDKIDASPTAPGAVQGALLSDSQIALLRRAVIIMTTLLVAGVLLLIGRIIYLARGPTTQAASAASMNAPLLADVRLALPAGAEIRHMSLAGSRLAVHHGQAGGGEAITVLDLATGAIVSRVSVERGK